MQVAFHAEILPESVDFPENVRQGIDGGHSPFEASDIDHRFGTLVREAVFGLPVGTDVVANTQRGTLEMVLPPEVAARVKTKLESLRALNGRQIWKVCLADIECTTIDTNTGRGAIGGIENEPVTAA